MSQIKIEKAKYNKFVQGLEQLRKECGIENKSFYAYLRYFAKRFEDFHGINDRDISFDKKTESGIIT